MPYLIDKRWPGARASGIARTRFIDDALIEALQDGIGQVVILGAGFDSRAYRIHGMEKIRVYEVDHPATISAKREHLRRLLGSLPSHVTFIGIDFNEERLENVLATPNFDATRRSFFIWEGVTNYLTEGAVNATLRFISTNSAGSRLIFTYIDRAVLDQPSEFSELEI